MEFLFTNFKTKKIAVFFQKKYFAIFFFLVFLVSTSGINAQSFDYGNGSNGAFNSTGNISLAGGTYNYTSFTLNAGHTITVTGTNPLIIKVQGTAIINGTITGAGANGSGQTAGAGGGGGGKPGGAGGNQGGLFSNGSSGGAGTAFGSLAGGSGGSGGTIISGGSSGGGGQGNSSISNVLLTTIMNSTNLLGGAGGGGGGGKFSGGGRGGGGGGGAGAMSITAYSISGTGTLNFAGGNGASNANNGGGGGGGTVWLQFRNSYSFTTGNINVAGGTGGGAGAAGRFLLESDINTVLSSNSPNCGTVTISRSTNPPAGVTWYWQTTSNGTSTANSGSTYGVTTSGTYYLRAFYNGNWLDRPTKSIVISVGSPPAAVAASSTLSDICPGTNFTLNAGTLTGGDPVPSIGGVWLYEWRRSDGTVLQSYSTTTSLTTTENIPGSYSYYLYVKPSICNLETQSNIVTVFVRTAASGTPTLSAPVDNVTVNSATPILLWTGGNLGDHPSRHYDIEIDGNIFPGTTSLPIR